MPAYKSDHHDPFRDHPDSLKENLGDFQKVEPIEVICMGLSLKGKVYIPFKERALQGQAPKTIWEIPFSEEVTLPETDLKAKIDPTSINQVEGLENALLSLRLIDEAVFQSSMIYKWAKKMLNKKGVQVEKVVVDFKGSNPLEIKEGIRLYPQGWDGKYIPMYSMDDAEEKIKHFFG